MSNNLLIQFDLLYIFSSLVDVACLKNTFFYKLVSMLLQIGRLYESLMY